MADVSITCPECGHEFTIGVQNFSDYEILVAKWLDGKVAPKGTQGYDVCDCKELPGVTIQVKYSNEVKKGKNRRGGKWAFGMHSNKTETRADIYVLFGCINKRYEVFVMSHEIFISHSKKASDGFLLQSDTSTRAWIQNYLVLYPPEKNLLHRIRATIADKQLTLL